MAIQRANDTIKILFSADLDASRASKATTALNKQLQKSQDTIDNHLKRVMRLEEQNAKSMSKYHKQELAQRKVLIAQEERQMRIASERVELAKNANSVYRVSGKAIKNNTSLMASLSGKQKQLNRALEKEQAIRRGGLGLGGGRSVIGSGVVGSGDAASKRIAAGHNAEAKSINKATRAHHELRKARGEQSSFAGKVSTTGQYAIAGAGLYAIATAARAAVDAVIELDTATRTMSAVLNISLDSARRLGSELQTLGTVVGGNQKEIFDLANELGRAGIETKDLLSATESTIRLARLTGDSFNDASRAVITYRQVFGSTGATVEELGDKIAVMANESRLSVKDIGIVSNFALSAAKKIGLTVDAIGGLSAAFSNAGVSASTIGTQIRSLSNLFLDESTAVKSFFLNVGVTQKNLLRTLQKGGQESDNALRGFASTLAELSDEDFVNFTAGLDIRVGDAISKLRQQHEEVSRISHQLTSDSAGALSSTKTIIDGYAVSWEKAVNSMSKNATNVLNPAMRVIVDSINDISITLDLMAYASNDAKDSLGDAFIKAVPGMKVLQKTIAFLGGSYTEWGKAAAKAAEEEEAREDKVNALLRGRTTIIRALNELASERSRKGSSDLETKRIEDEIIYYDLALKRQNNLIDKTRTLHKIEEIRANIRKTAAAEQKEEGLQYTELLKTQNKELLEQKEILANIGKDAKGDKKEKDNKASVTTIPPVNVNAFLDFIKLRNESNKSAVKQIKQLTDLTTIQIKEDTRLIKLNVEGSAKLKDIKDKTGKITGQAPGDITGETAKSILDITKSAKDYASTSQVIVDLNQLAYELSQKQDKNGRTLVDNVIERVTAIQTQYKLVDEGLQSEYELQTRNTKSQLKQVALSQDLLGIQHQLNLGHITAVGYQRAKVESLNKEVERTQKLYNEKKKAGDNPESLKAAADALVKAKTAAGTAEVNLIVKQNKIKLDLEKQYLRDLAALRKSETPEGRALVKSIGGPTPEFQQYQEDRAKLQQDIIDKQPKGTDATPEEAKAIDQKLAVFDQTYADKVESKRADTSIASGPSEVGALEIEHQNRLTAITHFYDAKRELLINDADSEKERLRLDEEEKTAIATAGLQVRLQQTGVFAGQAAQILEDLRTAGLAKGRRSFEAMKALQIASATINTYTTANAAYAAAFIPPTPASPVIGAISAAAAIASGLANVAQIKAQTYHTGGMVGPTGNKLRTDEVPAILQTGEMVLNRNEVAQAQAAPAQSGETVIINSMDPAVIESWASSRAGRKVIRNIVNN